MLYQEGLTLLSSRMQGKQSSVKSTFLPLSSPLEKPVLKVQGEAFSDLSSSLYLSQFLHRQS